MSAHPRTRSGPVRMRLAPPVQSLAIEWGVSRSAMGDRAPEGRSSLLTLRYEASPGEPESWVLIDPRSGARSDVGIVPVRDGGVPDLRSSGGRVHVHSPTIYAFVSIEHDEPELMYARTTMFERMGIAGGRYQPQRVDVRMR